MPKKKIKKEQYTASKTEDQLRLEARERMESERLALQSRKPKSDLERKVENFWYHYKFRVLFIIVAVVAVGSFLFDTAFTPKPDLSVVMVTSRVFTTEMQDTLKAEFVKYASDINGDGQVLIQLDYIPYEGLVDNPDAVYNVIADNPAGVEGMYAYGMKFVATVSAGVEQIYILDMANYNYLIPLGGDEAFLDLGAVPGSDGFALPLLNTRLADSPNAKYYEGLSFYMRDILPTDKNTRELEGNERFIQGIAGQQEGVG